MRSFEGASPLVPRGLLADRRRKPGDVFVHFLFREKSARTFAVLAVLITVVLILGSGVGSPGTTDFEGEFSLHVRSQVIPWIVGGPVGGPHLRDPKQANEGTVTEFLFCCGADPAADGTPLSGTFPTT